MTPLMLVGSAIKAGGALYEGYEKSRSLKAGAKAKEIEAGEAELQGRWGSMRLNEEMRRTLATQRELYGEAGVSLEGAPENLMRETKQAYVLDRLMLGRNTAVEAAGLRADADELRKAARAAQVGGIVGAFTSFF